MELRFFVGFLMSFSALIMSCSSARSKADQPDDTSKLKSAENKPSTPKPDSGDQKSPEFPTDSEKVSVEYQKEECERNADQIFVDGACIPREDAKQKCSAKKGHFIDSKALNDEEKAHHDCAKEGNVFLNNKCLKYGAELCEEIGNKTWLADKNLCAIHTDLESDAERESIMRTVNLKELETRLQRIPKQNLLKNPPIFLFMVDTLRADYITDALTPNLKHFIEKESLHPLWSAGGATATHHSTFSLFWGMPSVFRERALFSKWLSGSPYLQLLKKSGYHIRFFGGPKWYKCVDPVFDGIYKHQGSEEANFQLLFSMKSRDLLSSCPEPLDKKKLDSQLKLRSAERDKNVIEHVIESIRTHKDHLANNIFIIFLDEVHDPYSWLGSAILDPAAPSKSDDLAMWMIIKKMGDKTFNKQDLELSRNNYHNAVISADYQFHTLQSFLKKEGLYDASLFFLFSDHGEGLLDNGTYETDDMGHGGYPTREKSRTVFGLKFPHGEHSVQVPVSAGLVDVFPTIFDYLGLEIYLKDLDLHLGENLLTKNESCEISFAPWGLRYLEIMGFDNGTEKMFLALQTPDPFVTQKIDVRRIMAGHDIVDEKSYTTDELSDMMNSKFSACWRKIFKIPKADPTHFTKDYQKTWSPKPFP